jgi:hypothetical protein
MSTARNILSVKYKDIVVIPFNMEAIDKGLDEHIKKTYPDKIEKNESFSLHRIFGFVKNSSVLIDRECVGEIINNDKIPLEVYGERPSESGKGVDLDMFPRFTFVVKLEDILKEYALPEVTLEKFMGDRFAYNNRIISNMRIIAGELNKATV